MSTEEVEMQDCTTIKEHVLQVQVTLKEISYVIKATSVGAKKISITMRSTSLKYLRSHLRCASEENDQQEDY